MNTLDPGKEIKSRKKAGDIIFENITLLFALILVGLVVYIAIEMFLDSSESRSKFGFGFIFSQNWDLLVRQRHESLREEPNP